MFTCENCLDIKNLYHDALQGRWPSLSQMSRIHHRDSQSFMSDCDVCRILSAVLTASGHDGTEGCFYFERLGDNPKRVLFSTDTRFEGIWVSVDPGK